MGDNSMSVGPFVRRLLGPFELPVSKMYRAFFFDVRSLANFAKKELEGSAILEFGCGEGLLTTHLSSACNTSKIIGIDITANVGRLFRGDHGRVSFLCDTVQNFAKSNANRFDLVIISDVLHHIPWHLHKEVLLSVTSVMKPGAKVVVKDWEKTDSLVYFMGYFSDRYITGDKIKYGSVHYFKELLKSVFGCECIEKEGRLPPWKNNFVVVARKTSG